MNCAYKQESVCSYASASVSVPAPRCASSVYFLLLSMRTSAFLSVYEQTTARCIEPVFARAQSFRTSALTCILASKLRTIELGLNQRSFIVRQFCGWLCDRYT